ncbi:tudor domain-containing protein 6 [Varanus komodoensis]|uniref:tudor domain-containing protein 6 n=1 Tax=Varanus komodoensis TaxID=61221 RepID=UPI001CF7CFA8|nr:tudor domain-containing protein 6 [Varanus komodoensis]
MCSALPRPGCRMALRVSFVEVRPEAPLVRLWGFPGKRREEYLRLAKEIQAKSGPRLATTPDGGDALAAGDLCLVELAGRWKRCRVVNRQRGLGQTYRVFLLDEGHTLPVTSHYLARGTSELFHLPPEVMSCILADLVPPRQVGATLNAAGGSKGLATPGSEMPSSSWTASAAELLGYLQGRVVSGLIREVLIPQHLVVLELPWLLAQMCQLGLACQISPSTFSTLLSISLQGSGLTSLLTELPSEPQPPILTPITMSQQDHVSLDYIYPQLKLNVIEPVIVTEIIDPCRVYCQLHSFSKAIQKLSHAMHQSFEASKTKDLQGSLPTPGSPCAARGIDGCWYRALLLGIYLGGGPENQPGAVAQVIYVDYGRKEFVTKRNVRHLPAEFFCMPVVTYACSLYNITDGGSGWTCSQVSQLKKLLLGKVMQAAIEAFCPLEHLYYVTFYGEDGLNFNCLYGVQAHCLTQCFLHSSQEYTSALTELEHMGTSAKKEPGSLLEMLSTLAAAPLPVVCLKAGECHTAEVSFLQDPSEFWVHLLEHCQPLCHLKQKLSDFYSKNKKLEGILRKLKPGSLCCVILKENSYHRAVVTKVQGKSIEVYLVDQGNTEIVDLYQVKELLPQFRELPAVALRCTLAIPSPNQSWSSDAVDYFRKAVLNKEVVIKVLGMQRDTYTVELFDHSLVGEKNVGKIMSQDMYAEDHEDQVLETLQKITDKPLGKGPEGAVKEDSSTIPNSLSCNMQNYSEIRPGFSCNEQLNVGSTVEVIVSYIENPSLFWCQLAKSSQDLKVLMTKIQDYCIHSAEPHDWPNPVCLAKFSEDEKWYRALIINKVNATEVEVAYVDYGNKECVSLENICAAKTEFLYLEAQAFRCSLYNLIQPKGQNPFVWDEKATEAFFEFVNSASRLELKCTIFALATLNKTHLVNIVDLITPFESVCHFLTRKGLARPVQPQKPLIPSVHLLSYYYSTHDIKIGSEEVVYVTHVNDPCLFYCQLARSENVLVQLASNIDKLNKMGHSLKTSRAPGNLYLAKYTDGCWYRAIVTSAKTTKEVFFVDFGNTQLFRDEDLIVVPSDAYELLLLPMQAIKCSLSDIADVQKDAAVWFEKAVLDKQLKALIVAKEPDGKLIIELYDGKMQINAKLRQGLGLQCGIGVVENETSFSRRRATGKNWPLTGIIKSESKRRSAQNLEILGSSTDSGVHRQEIQLQQERKMAKFPGTAEEFNRNDSEESKKASNCACSLMQEKIPENKSRNLTEANAYSSLKKLCGLPQKSIYPGLKTMVYVSHINNPSDFYVQLVEDEPLLDSISEKLNNPTTVENLKGQSVHIGDLLCADFSEDGLRYRAVVNKESTDDFLSVQYIDYGNTSVVNICKTCRLLEDCLSFPVMSIHCTLHGIKITEWTQEAVQYFFQMTSEVQMNSEFVVETEGKWAILLFGKNGNVTVDLANRYPVYKKSILVETTDKIDCKADLTNLCENHLSEYSNASSIPDAKSFVWKIPNIGETVKTLSVTVKSPESFWCRLFDADVIHSIERKLEEVQDLSRISLENIAHGYSCLAKNNEDDTFYRAVVRNIKGNTLSVIDVDYGTEAFVSTKMIRQISDELLSIPPQAFLCSLFGFNSAEGSWTEGISKIFGDILADSPLDITVIDKQNYGPLEIPLFSVKVECQNICLNEQMKPFWKHNVENPGSNLGDIHKPEGQKKTEEESSEGELFEMKASACSFMPCKDTIASEDVLCSAEIQAVVDARSTISLDAFSLTLHVYETIPEAVHKGNQRTITETFHNKRDCYISEKESDNLLSVDASEMQAPVTSEMGMLLKQDHLETLPASNDTKQQQLELDILRMHSAEEMLELEITELSPSQCDDSECSELNLLEVAHMEGELEQSPSSTDTTDSLLLELETPKVQSCPNYSKTMADTLPLELLAVSHSASNVIKSSFSKKLEEESFCNECLLRVHGTGKYGIKPRHLEWETPLEKSCVETLKSHGKCERSYDDNFVGEDSLRSMLLDEEQVKTSSYDTDKEEIICNLKGFDTGSKCMVWSGGQWYEALILGLSAEGTKVLNLSSGNEEVISPADVWHRLPELESNLTEELGTMDTWHSLPAGDLPVEGKTSEVFSSL